MPNQNTFETLAKPKLHISKAVADAMTKQNLSMRQLAENIGGMKHPQIYRITSGQNYNINTLLRVMDELGLTLAVIPKVNYTEIKESE